MTTKKILFAYLDKQKECELSGWRLYDIIHDATGCCPYPNTLLQMCREYADITGGDFICIDHQKSIYKFVPGFPLGNAIIDKKEML